MSSIPQPLAQLSLTRPGSSWDKGASLQLSPVELARGFVYLCICMDVYSYQSALNATLGPHHLSRVWARSDL